MLMSFWEILFSFGQKLENVRDIKAFCLANLALELHLNSFLIFRNLDVLNSDFFNLRFITFSYGAVGGHIILRGCVVRNYWSVGVILLYRETAWLVFARGTVLNFGFLTRRTFFYGTFKVSGVLHLTDLSFASMYLDIISCFLFR